MTSWYQQIVPTITDPFVLQAVQLALWVLLVVLVIPKMYQFSVWLVDKAIGREEPRGTNDEYISGYEYGRETGMLQGKAEGYTEGLQLGRAHGYQQGHKAAHDDELSASYWEGYSDGKTVAKLSTVIQAGNGIKLHPMSELHNEPTQFLTNGFMEALGLIPEVEPGDSVSGKSWEPVDNRSQLADNTSPQPPPKHPDNYD